MPCDGDCQGQRQASRRTAKPPADQRLVELAAGVSKTRMPVVRPQPEIHARFEPAATTGRCPARALEAPFLRDHNYNALATHPLGIVLTNLAKTADDRRKDHLDDVVAFSTKEIVHARLLLLVPQLILKRKAKILRFLKRRAMILRCFAADGTILDDITIDGGGGPSKIVHTSADLPVTWRDKKGPWFCPVSEAVAYLNGVRGQRKDQFELILVDTKVKPGTAYLQIGLLDVEELIANGLGRPSYLVGVVETQAAAEVERYHTESTIKSHKVETLNGALKGLHDPPALLLPSSTYTVHVDYEWATCDKDGSAVGAWTAESQDFQFRTDNQPLAPNTVVPPDGDTPSAPGSYAPGSPRPATMPVRLDPWVMLTDPDEGEHFYFYGKPIRVVFSVDYLLDMFGTYGVPLQARVRAASFANSSPSSPNFSKTVKALSSADAKLIPSAFVFTPWEDSIRDIIKDAPCIDSGGDISRQTVLDLDLVLEPRTDYVFDIEPVDAPVPPVDSSVTPLFRRSFTTSRYQDATAMCAAVKGARAHEFRAAAADVTDLEALVSAPGPMSGAALDAALRKAGLRPVLEVTDPEIEVLWVLGAGGLQPRIFVIRTPEPLVRTRREPEEYEPPGQPRLQRKIIRLVDKPYLEVVQTPGVPGAPVMHIVSQPALNTVIVVVDAGRDTPIDLSLRRHDNAFLGEGSGVADVSLLEMRLDAATWEVAS